MTKGTARAQRRPTHRTTASRIVGDNHRSNKTVVSNVGGAGVRCSPLGNGIGNPADNYKWYYVSHYGEPLRRETASGTAGCPDYPFPVAIGSHTDTTGRMIPAMNARAGEQRGRRAINIGSVSFGAKAARLTLGGRCQ